MCNDAQSICENCEKLRERMWEEEKKRRATQERYNKNIENYWTGYYKSISFNELIDNLKNLDDLSKANYRKNMEDYLVNERIKGVV